jgi:hypothetical protein
LATVQEGASKEQALLTPGGKAALAVKAFSAGNCERQHYCIALLVILDIRTKFDNFTSRLVTLLNREC